MAQDRWLELPEHVVAKIQKVLGIAPSALPEHDVVSLIEELCDTALMFEREEHAPNQTEEEEPPDTATGAPTAQPSVRPPAEDGPGL